MIALANSTSTVTNEELIERCSKADAKAWNELVDRYGRLVYSIPRKYGMCEADADDVFQNVFIKLNQQMSAIREPARLSAWLITTAHRECWRMGQLRFRECKLADRWSDPQEPPIELAAKWEQQQLVREALMHLSKQERDLMTELFLATEHPNYEDIAGRLNMKVGSIGPMRARCFKKLERILIDLGIDERCKTSPPTYEALFRPQSGNSRNTSSAMPSTHSALRFPLAPTFERNCA